MSNAQIIRTLLIFSCFLLLRSSVFAQQNNVIEDTVMVRHIAIVGNNRTNEKIIRRELNFREGDSISKKNIELKIEKSKENLKNTSLFTTLNIYYIVVAGKFIDFTVNLEERWYFWPSFYFNHTERNFNTWWEDKDLGKLAFGAGFQIKNMRGRNENFKFDSRFGYSTRLEFAYDKIALDKARKHHLGIYFSFQIQDQLPYITRNNKPQYIKIRGVDLLSYQETNLKYYFRPKHKIKHHFELKYYNFLAQDTIIELNPNYLYDNNLSLSFFRFRYFFEYENRDFIYYPLDGQYFSAELIQNGLNLIQNNKYKELNLKFVLINHKKKSEYLSIGNALFLYYSPTESKSYAFVNGLGYRINLRGFEYYTMEGNKSILLQNQLKFTIIKPHSFTMNFMPSSKFSKAFFATYLNIFTDIGYVSSNKELAYLNNNTLVNKLVYSYGIGLDFVSYYDKVMRIDFARNSIGEYGLYFNFKASLHKP